MALKPCPMCKGRRPVSPLAVIQDRPCDFCGGLGVLNTEASCTCGRPAVRKLNDMKICTRYECAKQVMETTVKA